MDPPRDGQIGYRIRRIRGKLAGGKAIRGSLPYRCFLSPVKRAAHTALYDSDGGEELSNIIVAAYSRYCVSNPLHPDVFPAIRKMEAEVVAMCLKMYRGPSGSSGTMTSAGTESIIMAVKTYRDWAKAVKGIKEPEMYGRLIHTSVYCSDYF